VVLSRGYRCEAEAGPNEGAKRGVAVRLAYHAYDGYIPGLERATPSAHPRARGEFGAVDRRPSRRPSTVPSLSDDVALTPRSLPKC